MKINLWGQESYRNTPASLAKTANYSLLEYLIKFLMPSSSWPHFLCFVPRTDTHIQSKCIYWIKAFWFILDFYGQNSIWTWIYIYHVSELWTSFLIGFPLTCWLSRSISWQFDIIASFQVFPPSYHIQYSEHFLINSFELNQLEN